MSIRLKLLIPFISIICIAMLLIEELSFINAKKVLQQQVVAKLDELAEQAQRGVQSAIDGGQNPGKVIAAADTGDAGVSESAAAIGVYLIDEQGVVVAQRGPVIPKKQQGRLPRQSPNDNDLITLTEGLSGANVRAASRTVRGPNQQPWLLVVEQSETQFLQPLTSLRKLLLITAGCTLLIVALIAVLIARSLTVPIAKLVEGTDKLKRGELSHRVGMHANDELGQLSRSIDKMATELQMLVGKHRDAEHNVRSLNATLEQRIQQLAMTTEALEKSNIELKQYAFIASHDLQTPLRGIAGFAQLLEKKYAGQLDETADHYLERIVDGTKRLQQLIQELLVYSRVESRAAPFQQVSLNEVFDHAVELLQASIDDVGAMVTRENLPTVAGDHAQLSQLFQNLIANGLKYHGAEPAMVHIFADRKGDEWTISVQDNGIGIDPQYHSQVFEIFRRLHTQQDYPGTGIGLAVCRRIVEHHGGRIWLESQEGAGCTFFFTLAATPAPAEPSPVLAPA